MIAPPTQKKTLKIVILGDSGVGKTSLMNRYSQGKFTGQYKATIGADFVSKQVVVVDSYGQSHVVTLQIWDTAGQERFQSLGVGFYRGSDGAILTYDVTDPHSLDHLQHWKNEFLQHVGGGSYNLGGDMGGLNAVTAQFPFVVVGNKCDKGKDRLIELQQGIQWCTTNASTLMAYGQQQRPIEHFETSAKTAINVDEAFAELARLALNYEDFKRRSQPPKLFVPPTNDPSQFIDLRQEQQRNNTYPRNRNEPGCC